MKQGRSTGPTPETRAAVLTRAGNRCEACGGALVGMDGASIHHRKPRRMGGTKDPAINQMSNLIVLCGSGITGCHGNIEKNRRWAYTLGYLLTANDDPTQTPVLLRKRWVLLTDEGDIQFVTRDVVEG